MRKGGEQVLSLRQVWTHVSVQVGRWEKKFGVQRSWRKNRSVFSVLQVVILGEITQSVNAAAEEIQG